MDESHDNGMLVTYDCPQRMYGGEIGKVRRQEIWNGSVESFRAAHKGVAIIGYSRMSDGQVEPPTMLNEKLAMDQAAASPAAGVVTPEMLARAAEAASSMASRRQDGQAAPAAPSPPAASEEKVLKDGDSYIKVVGGKVYRLQWEQYDDGKAQFDRRIKVDDGKVYVTEWKELAER